MPLREGPRLHPFYQMVADAKRDAELMHHMRRAEQARNFTSYRIKHLSWAAHGMGGPIALNREIVKFGEESPLGAP